MVVQSTSYRMSVSKVYGLRRTECRYQCDIIPNVVAVTNISTTIAIVSVTKTLE